LERAADAGVVRTLTMVFSVQQVKYEFLAYMKEFDPVFSNWYVGLADQPKEALFDLHGVRNAEDPWLYKQLLTNRAACTVQNYFIEHLKTAGVPAIEQSEDVDCVYLYKIAAHTRQ
jgi:hypothetical protein